MPSSYKSLPYPYQALAGAFLLCCLLLGAVGPALARDDWSQAIERVRPSIVGVATYQKTRNPAVLFRGTGFAVGDGLHVVTNSHVVPAVMDVEKLETLVVMVGRGTSVQIREATKVAQDADHDVAILEIKGPPLPPLSLADSAGVREGQMYAFTGYPIGVVLGQYPVTHRAMISALTPVVIPGHNTNDLDVKAIRRLSNPFDVFQLDATAYPGNSGSPVYDPDSGLVIGVVNMVFVKGTKERALTEPSGITYAIPSRYIRETMQRLKTQ